MNRAVKGALLVWALLLMLAAAPLSAHAQEAISIEGQLKNGTVGAEVPQGVTITLKVYKAGQVQETREAVSDAEGGFSFEGVPGGGGKGFGYVINAEYAGGAYSFESDYPLPPEPLELMVYESTPSTEAIKVRSHTLVVTTANSKTRLMDTLEMVWLENTGDRTFVPDLASGGSMEVLRFSLPSTASNLEVQSNLLGGQIIQVDVGFGMTTQVPPGTHEIDYTYLASYADGKLTFAHSFPFGADIFRVFLLESLGQVTGTGLQEMEPLVDEKNTYRRLESSNLNAGAKVTLDFSGLPEPSLWGRWRDSVPGGNLTIVAIPVALGMALLALLAYVFFRKRRSSRATAEVTEEPEQGLSLTEALAHLDDRFQQGGLDEREYLQRRRELRDQALGSEESGRPKP